MKQIQTQNELQSDSMTKKQSNDSSEWEVNLPSESGEEGAGELQCEQDEEGEGAIMYTHQ